MPELHWPGKNGPRIDTKGKERVRLSCPWAFIRAPSGPFAEQMGLRIDPGLPSSIRCATPLNFLTYGEGPAPAVLNGWYDSYYPAGGPPHPADVFGAIQDPGDFFDNNGDTILDKGSRVVKFDRAGGGIVPRVNNGPNAGQALPFADGTFTWNIMQRYGVGSPDVGNDTDWYGIERVQHQFHINATPHLTVKKGEVGPLPAP